VRRFNLYASQPNESVALSRIQQEATEKQLPKIISYKLIFSLSAKLHLETGLAFNTTLILLGSCGSGATIPDLHLWGSSITKSRTFL
jgi:hypothetical protein